MRLAPSQSPIFNCHSIFSSFLTTCYVCVSQSSEIVEGSTAVAADAVAEKVSRRSRGRTPGPAAVAVVETVTVTEVEEIKEAVFIEEESVQELALRW